MLNTWILSTQLWFILIQVYRQYTQLTVSNSLKKNTKAMLNLNWGGDLIEKSIGNNTKGFYRWKGGFGKSALFIQSNQTVAVSVPQHIQVSLSKILKTKSLLMSMSAPCMASSAIECMNMCVILKCCKVLWAVSTQVKCYRNASPFTILQVCLLNYSTNNAALCGLQRHLRWLCH